MQSVQSPLSDHNRDGLIEPDERLGPRFHVVGAHILASKVDGKVPFLLLNPTNKGIVRKRKTNVGTFIPIQCISNIVPLENSQHNGSQTPGHHTSARTTVPVNILVSVQRTVAKHWDPQHKTHSRPPDRDHCVRVHIIRRVVFTSTDLVVYCYFELYKSYVLYTKLTHLKNHPI